MEGNTREIKEIRGNFSSCLHVGELKNQGTLYGTIRWRDSAKIGEAKVRASNTLTVLTGGKGNNDHTTTKEKAE